MNIKPHPFLKALTFVSSKKEQEGNGPLYAVNDNRRRQSSASSPAPSKHLFLIAIGAIIMGVLLYFFLPLFK